MRWRHWLCFYLPWHRWTHSFWASERAEIVHCMRCKQEWAMNHEIEAVLPFDAAMKAFYRERGHA